MNGTPKNNVEERRKYVRAFNATMVKIWREQIALLGVIDTGRFTLNGRHFNDCRRQVHRHYLEQAFNTYGLFVDYGTGRNTHEENPGDIGKANGRKRKRWFSRKYFASVMNIQEFYADSSRTGVLPCHFQRPQSRHHAPRRHSLSVFSCAHW